jgi:hypothetical protein
MATLLTMLNDLRVLLREEEISAVSSTDNLTQALIKLINRATKDVLESRSWSFDKRHDGRVEYLPMSTGTGVTTSSTVVRITDAAAERLFFSGNDRVARVRVTSDSTYPDLSYRVTSADWVTNAGEITMTVDGGYSGSTGTDATATWELYATDVALGTTVRKVLSVWDEEQPTQLYFFEDEIQGDRAWPSIADETGEPEGVVIGGTITASYDSDSVSAGTTGMRMSLYPVPETNSQILYYRYVYRHAEMSAATDTLTGVPDKIIRLIVDRAFYYCLASNIESDPIAAAHAAKQYRIDLELAGREDRVAPNRRRILRPYGGVFARHPNARWNTREVPSP